MERYSQLRADENFTVVVLGGSIAAGQGAIDAPSFPVWTEKVLQTYMGKNVVVHNGAIPGTLSSYMSGKRIQEGMRNEELSCNLHDLKVCFLCPHQLTNFKHLLYVP